MPTLTKPSRTKVHTRYRNAKGDLIPGVTTILGLRAKPALVHAAWKLGTEGLDYRKVWGQAADAGTLAHYLIECDLKGQEPDPENLAEFPQSLIDKAETAYLAFLDWKGTLGHIETVASEVGLISERYQYGGTTDWVLQREGEATVDLVDFKSGKAIYPEMTWQLAAYQKAWDEMHPDHTVGCCYLVRLGKLDGAFERRPYYDLTLEWHAFYHLRQLYDLEKTMKQRGGKR